MTTTVPTLVFFQNILRVFGLLLLVHVADVSAKIDDNSLVEVYDNVLSGDAATWLHTNAVANWHNKDVAFIFPLEEPSQYGPIEQVLNDIMHQLYPDTTSTSEASPRYYVEFWKRTPWAHISAHADMDEGWGIQNKDKPFRHPETGHVLYLEMGSQVHGPTLVWNVSSGGDLYRQPTSEMVVVPAVQGRLLRFQGRLLHAVPRPADLYWSHEIDTRGDGPEFQRSVLLFNSWPYEDGLLVDYELTTKQEDATETEEQKQQQQQQQPLHTNCNPKSDWTAVEVTKYVPEPPSSWWSSLFSTPTKMFQVPLMGNPKRRGTEKYVAKLVGPVEMPDLLEESSQVTLLEVQVPEQLLVPSSEL